MTWIVRAQAPPFRAGLAWPCRALAVCSTRPSDNQRSNAVFESKDRDIERLRGLLARLEWAGTVVFDEWYDKGKCCPVCKREPDEGHTGGCELADALGRQ